MSCPLTGALPEPSEAEIERGRNAGALFQMLTGHWVAQTVRAAADLHVADHVAAGSRTADEVAKLESSDRATTYRLMRACVSLGLLAYEDGRFTTTPMGELLRAGVPGSLREVALLQGSHGIWQGWGVLPEAVRRGETQFKAALGVDIFDYFAKNPGEAALFAKAMSNMTGLVIEDTVRLLDFGGATVVIDVGGASGALVLGLMKAHPEIQGKVFDLPHAVASAQHAADQAGLSDRFSAVDGDFFESVPAADYYLLKSILHDWRDEECLSILRNCRKAVLPSARALVIEAVVGEIGKPDPAAIFDMNMLAVTRGRERTLAEFDAMFDATGWRRVGLSPTRLLYTLLEVEAV
jgi:O-methyltransferase domain/Dimerisation domain